MVSPPSSPPHHHHNHNHHSDRDKDKDKDLRPRFFDAKARAKCWQDADVVDGRHPERWRRDVAGNVVCKRFWNCHGCLCYEYDHIVPFSKALSQRHLHRRAILNALCEFLTQWASA